MKRKREFSEVWRRSKFIADKRKLEARASGRVQSGCGQTEQYHAGEEGGEGEARKGS